MFLKKCRITYVCALPYVCVYVCVFCVYVCVCVCVRAVVDNNMLPKSSNITESSLRETCTFKEK
jgi:hypothetical protein